MGKYLKSYKQYPAGTLVISKSYSLWKRFIYWLTKKRRAYNTIYVLPALKGVGISKVDLLLNDFYLFVPIKPYTKSEIKKYGHIIESCHSIKDYLILLNIIRPGTIDVNASLEQFKTNKNYKKIILDNEPFQEVNKK